MRARTHGFRLIESPRCRAWGDVVADLFTVACEFGASGRYVSPHPHLFITFDLGDGEFRVGSDRGAGVHRLGTTLSYIPAHLEVTGHAVGIRRFRHLDLHLPESAVLERLGPQARQVRLDRPQLGIVDPQLGALAQLVADACDDPADAFDRYGEGLLTAFFARLFPAPQSSERCENERLGGEERWRALTAYIDAHCFETITLAELAAMAGLSQSRFGRLFKASMGVSPLRWHMIRRIRRVQELLLLEHVELKDAAAIAGFADQAHLTRSFKSVTGQTPSEWLRRTSAS